MTRKLATSCITVVVDSLLFPPSCGRCDHDQTPADLSGPERTSQEFPSLPPNRGPDETGSAISATLNEVPMSHRSKWQWSRDNLKRGE